MSNQGDHGFADAAEAKGMIRAAVEFLLRDAPGNSRASITEEILNLVWLIAKKYDPEMKLPDPLDDAPGG